MCGIFAIIDKTNKSIDQSILSKGINCLSHRGPDWEGVSIDRNVGLAHRRLSVFDLSKNGNQPMSREGCSIVFNGAIYNYPELKKELEHEGIYFQSHTDTEVILASYLKYGKDCIKRFNGQWAFVIYDPKNRIVIACRDRYGIKPLYYYENQNGIYFASEIKAFKELPSWQTEVNHDRAIEFLAYGMHDHSTETLFANVKKVPAGSMIIYHLPDNSYKQERYYSLLDIQTNDIPWDKALHNTKALLERSIALRLRSDVPIGVALSGGLDSSFVTMSAQNIRQKVPRSFSIVYHDESINESLYLDALPEGLLARNQRFTPDWECLMDLVDKVLWHQEEPFNGMSVITQFYLMQKIRQEGIKVVLDGQGADEIFCGYEKFYLFQLRKEWRKKPIVSLYQLFHLRKRFPTFDIWKRLNIYQHTITQQLPDWISTTSERKIYSRKKEESILEISKNLFDGLGIGALLRYEDKNAMAHGVESRLPYLDHNLVEYVLSLPDNYKVSSTQTKRILREASRSLLPHQIVDRRDKLGFVTPEERWIKKNKDYFREEIKKMEDELSNYIDCTKVYQASDYKVWWRVFIFGKWMKRWG